MQSASRKTATARMMPISLGASGPDSAKVRKHGDHDAGGGDDNAAGRAQRHPHGVLRVPGPVVVLSGG